MMKTIFRKVMWVERASVFLVGVAVILVAAISKAEATP